MPTYLPAPLMKYGLNMSSGDKLYTYQAGSSTPLAVHTNSTGTSATKSPSCTNLVLGFVFTT